MAAPIRGSRSGDPTEAELQERIDMLAAGYSPVVVALRFGRSIGTIRNQATRDKDKILARKEELTGEVQAIAATRWINDTAKSIEVLEALAEGAIDYIADPDLEHRDRSRYNRDVKAFIHESADMAGLLTQRIQARVETIQATNCIVGFSCECGRGCDQVETPFRWGKSESTTEPTQEPAPSSPVTPSSEIPEKWRGRNADPTPPQDPQYEPPKSERRGKPRIGFM